MAESVSYYTKLKLATAGRSRSPASLLTGPLPFFDLSFRRDTLFPQIKPGAATMDHGTALVMSVGAMGLCAIIGIYYVWARKLPKPPDDKDGSQR
jgi:hypothetical protein